MKQIEHYKEYDDEKGCRVIIPLLIFWKGRFISMRKKEQCETEIVYELREPLTVIMAQCEYIRKHSADMDKKDILEEVKVIYRQMERMNQTMVNLLKQD